MTIRSSSALRLAWSLHKKFNGPRLVRAALMLNRSRLPTWASSDPRPRLDHVTCQAPTREQLDSEVYSYWCAQIRDPPRYHRKQWEFVYILEALRQAGMLAHGRKGIGFGVGQEPLPAVLAAHGCRVLASDLRPEAASAAAWQSTGQHASGKAALNSQGICPPERFDELVDFRWIDMNDLGSLDKNAFDFTWSSCALEHTGSLAAGTDFILASIDLLTPGAVAGHTTELNISSSRHTLTEGATVLYRKRDLEDLAAALRAKGCDIDLNFYVDWRDEIGGHVDIPPYTGEAHLRLLLGPFISTSYGLLIRKRTE